MKSWLGQINEELSARNAELDRLTGDLSTLINAIDIPLVLVDRRRRVRRFTPPAEDLFNLIATDVGCPIDDMNPKVAIAGLCALIDATIAYGMIAYREMQDPGGRWYALRVYPYMTGGIQISGALIALVDIDAAKRASAAVVETIPSPLMVLDERCRIIDANPAFTRAFQLDGDRVERQSRAGASGCACTTTATASRRGARRSITASAWPACASARR